MNEKMKTDTAIAEETKLTIAGKVDRGVWDKCQIRAFNESRIKTNSGIVEAALIAYGEGK